MLKDVTSQWEPLTNGGYEVVRVEEVDSSKLPLLVMLRRSNGFIDIAWASKDGASCVSTYNLIPRKPESQLKGLPLGHWWRGSALDQMRPMGRIMPSALQSFIDGLGMVCWDELRTKFQHTATPDDPTSWVTGW